MPTTINTPTKAQLEAALAGVCDLLDEALDPELTREEVIAKVREAYNLAAGNDDDEDGNGDGDEDDDDQLPAA